MKRLLFTVAVACLFAVNALAADPPVTTTVPPPAPSGTVLAPTAPTVMTTSGTTSTRRYGLFSRLRNRMSGPVYSTPGMTTTGTIAAGHHGPGRRVPTPMPMPTTTEVDRRPPAHAGRCHGPPVPMSAACRCHAMMMPGNGYDTMMLDGSVHHAHAHGLEPPALRLEWRSDRRLSSRRRP